MPQGKAGKLNEQAGKLVSKKKQPERADASEGRSREFNGNK